MVKITCKQCGESFEVKNYRSKTAKYCSALCRQESHKASNVIRICANCKNEFILKSHQIKSSYAGKYCSIKCRDEHKKGDTVTCDCGKEFHAYRSRIAYYSKLYCSNDCRMNYGYTGRLTDEKIEITEYEKFTRSLRSTARYLIWRKACLDRDKGACKCGETKGVSVHHEFTMIDFIREHGMNKEAIESDTRFYDIDNGVTLCKSCHLKKHTNLGDKSGKS